MHFQRVYLDSNVFISAFGDDSNHELALQIMTVIANAGSDPVPVFVTSELTLAEVLVRPMRLGDQGSQLKLSQVLTTSEWLTVAPINRNTLWGAAHLRSQYHGLKTPDAIHVSTAIAKRCSHFLTADAGIKGSYSIDLPSHDDAGAAQGLDVIRPDAATLQAVSTWVSA